MLPNNLFLRDEPNPYTKPKSFHLSYNSVKSFVTIIFENNNILLDS